MSEILKEGSLAQKFIEFHEQGTNGILTIEHQRVRKVVSFEKGKIRYATSNLKNESLLHSLMDTGKIDKSKALSLENEPGISMKTVQQVSSLGLISEEVALQEGRNLIAKIVKSCFPMRGNITHREGLVNLASKVTVDIQPQEIILDYYRSEATSQECKAILGQESSIPCHAPDASEKVKIISFDNLEKDILKMVDGQTGMGELLKIIPSTSEKTLRGLAILYLFNIIAFKDQASPDAPSPLLEIPEEEAQEQSAESDKDQEEVKSYMSLYEKHARSNHFQLLGVQRYSSTEDIQKSYYQLAKELHPDKFQKESMEQVKPLMESLFSRISEAYEILSSEEKRKAYEAELFENVKSKAKVLEEQQDNITTARGNFLMGKKFFSEGKYSDACKFLETAVNLDGTRWEYYFHLAMTQAINPRFRSQAIYNFKKVISMNPAHAEAYFHLGLLYKKSGNMTEAMNMLKCTLQWDPENAQAQSELKEFEKLVRK
jgi:tetratricopeptide (TPR) repeat protein